MPRSFEVFSRRHLAHCLVYRGLADDPHHVLLLVERFLLVLITVGTDFLPMALDLGYRVIGLTGTVAWLFYQAVTNERLSQAAWLETAVLLRHRST